MTTTTTTGATRADVTAVIANIDQGEALRDRIKALTAELKVHEDLIKDALGECVEGVDSKGRVLVRYPHRNRSGLNRAMVQERMDPKEYGECVTETSYRTLLYGESDK